MIVATENTYIRESWMKILKFVGTLLIAPPLLSLLGYKIVAWLYFNGKILGDSPPYIYNLYGAVVGMIFMNLFFIAIRDRLIAFWIAAIYNVYAFIGIVFFGFHNVFAFTQYLVTSPFRDSLPVL